MIELRLTPHGQLRLVHDDASEQAWPKSIIQAFGDDWREGLFMLAAEQIRIPGSLTLPYWREFAAGYLTQLCHVPEGENAFALTAPSAAELSTLTLTAPPMPGGEYLSPELLSKIWSAVDGWAREAARTSGGVSALLERRAPAWRQVGRVCMHLAENKQDPERPFAFLATYTAGFGATDRLRHLPLHKALEQYAGERNRPALIRLLSPVNLAAEQCDWVRELFETGGIYRPLAWTPEQAYQLLKSVPQLEASGLTVRLPDWWRKRPRPRVSVRIGERKQSTLGAEAMLDFQARAALGDAELSAAEIEALLEGGDGLVYFKGQWVEVDREKFREALAHWEQLQAQAHDGEISFIEGMRLLAGATEDLRHAEHTDAQREWAYVEAGAGLREILAGLRDPGRLSAPLAGNGLRAVLRPYQREGVSWLHFLTGLGLGACLADDMGLGKTVQVLALLMDLRSGDNRRPSLLIVPASLMNNWKSEAARFTPALRLLLLHPAETPREKLEGIAQKPASHFKNADLIITTYAMLGRQPWLAACDWRLVILDEAQAIKNPSTRQAKAAKQLKARARIALTGTPVENRLGDLWSLFDFINPGLLGSAKTFKSFVNELQDQGGQAFEPLRKLAGPYILRRLKTDRSIIADLPEKTETYCYCNLTKLQVKHYCQIVENLERALDQSEGIARRGLVLQSLMRLKQICNHPSQLTGDGDYAPADSGKFQRLGAICAELAERQDKALIFTQFREIIDPLVEHLTRVFGRRGLSLHGTTNVKKRKEIVAAFQEDDGPPFFILSLKAGGVGLNLTAAAHVIHFDRWWNPAVENQATDRAFRIGQKRNVLVHKFVTSGTIEERIDQLIEEKRKLADEVLSGENEIKLTELPDEELLNLVRLDLARATL